MNAVILAGGFGSRLKPLTDETIKPMLPLCNTPTIDYAVSHLRSFGVRDIVFTLAHKPEQIIEWAVGYSDTVCRFSIETHPLGTAGGVKAAEKFLDDTFIVASGDALENVDFASMLNKHVRSKSDLTMAVKHEKNTSLYGVVETDAWGTVTGFKEKPAFGESTSTLINCGIYIINKSALKYVPKRTKFDFAKDLFPILLERGKMSVFIHDGYWCDIGDVKSYYKANFDVLGGGFFEPCRNNFRNIYASYHIGSGGTSVIACDSKLVGNISRCIVGRGSRVSSGSVLENCIVMDGVTVKGRYADCIIGNGFALNVGHGLLNESLFAEKWRISEQFSDIFS